MRFLVIDDSVTMLDIISCSLRLLGYRDIIEAKNGFEGLIRMEGGVDVILTDLNMPEMDGISFIRKVRERDKNIPILVLTSEARREFVISSIQAGADGYIVKPFTTNLLKDKLDCLFRIKSHKPRW